MHTGNESPAEGISSAFQQLCPLTHKANKKLFTTSTYTHEFVLTNILHVRAVGFLQKFAQEVDVLQETMATVS